MSGNQDREPVRRRHSGSAREVDGAVQDVAVGRDDAAGSAGGARRGGDHGGGAGGDDELEVGVGDAARERIGFDDVDAVAARLERGGELDVPAGGDDHPLAPRPASSR